VLVFEIMRIEGHAFLADVAPWGRMSLKKEYTLDLNGANRSRPIP